MTGEPLARMVNLSTGNVVGELDATQLAFLRKHLEQASESDTSFVFVPETADWMREQGAKELANLLQKELGSAKELSVGIAPLLRDVPGRVRGRLLKLETQSPLAGYKVEALDHHMFSDRLLGWNYSDAQGRFEVLFGEASLGHRRLSLHAEAIPEVKLRIMNRESAGTTTIDGSSSFPGIGASRSVAEAVVSQGGAPPIPVGGEPSDAATTIEENNHDEEPENPADGDAEEIVAAGATENEEAITDAAGENPEAAVIEGEVGAITGMETEWGDIFVSGDGKLIAPVLDGAAAICPQCGSTYDRGIATCGDCHVPLYQLS
jgi:hypothetical protein